MMTDVYIAGTDGTVIYRDNDELFCRSLNNFETPHLCRAGEVSFMLDCGAEFIPVNNFRGFDLLRPDVELERTKQQALSLSLSGLDNDLTEETRMMCIDAAEELVSDEQVLHFLKARLLARLVPETADITGGLACALRCSAVKLGSLYKTMRVTQADIELVNDAWRDIALSRFDSNEEMLTVETGLINAGVFAGMVEALQHEIRKKMETLVVTYGMRPDLKRLHPQLVMILNDIKNAIVRTGSFVDEEREFCLVAEETESASIDSDPIEELIRNCEQLLSKKVPGQVAKAKVDSQLQKISDFIRKGDLHRAGYFLVDLVKFQLTTGDKSHLGKSLCKLTKNALVNGAISFAEKLSEYSVLLKVDDPVIFSTRADVLKAKGKLDNALAAYDESINRHIDDIFTHTGRADVLKEMGNYAEALTAYDNTISRFEDAVVAHKGRADVLKDMGNYTAALAVYDETVNRFSGSVFVHTGRAEVLKEMRKYPEALSAYNETIKRFADDVFGYTGRAEVLKEMRKYPEALEAYDETIERFVESVVARSGRAEVLKEMGKYLESLAAYDETIELFTNCDVARSGRAEVLKEMGKYPEALAAYDETIKLFTNSVVPRNGRAEVLKEMGRYPEALAAYEETIKLFANDRHARNGFANLLILTGRGVEVPSVLNMNTCISRHDWRDYHVIAMSYLRSGNLDEAIQQLQYGLENDPFLDSKEYFANALAYAKIKKKEYADIEDIFNSLPETHNQFEAQKRHLFLVHSKAALDKKNEASDELALVPSASNIHIIKLKEFLDERYCLSGQFACAAADGYALLDTAIEEEEFFLVMTRKAA